MTSESTNGARAPMATADDSSVSSLLEGSSTITSSDPTTVSAAAHRSYVAKSYLQKNELVTEVQRLRIELKQKSDELEHLRSEMLLAIDDGDDKIDDLRRENSRLKQALANDEKMANEDAKMHDEILKRELSTLIERVHALEELNLRLSGEQAVAKQHFRLIRLTEAEYEELKAGELRSDLSLSELVSIRVHEELRDSSQQLARALDEKKRLDEENRMMKQQLAQLQRQFEDRSDESDQLKWTNTRLNNRLTNLLGGPGAVASHEPHSLFEPPPAQNSVKQQTAVEAEMSHLRSQLDSVTKHLTSERQRLVQELDAARESLRVAVDEGMMLRRQAIDSGQRSVFLEERMTSLSAQIDTLKNGREELLEKYLACKEEARVEFNERLIHELDELRSKNTAEYEKLHRQTKEVFEQESASLRMSRDTTIAERDRLSVTLADSNNRYEKVLVEFKSLQFSLESQTADLVSQLRVRSFELDRLRALLDETDANLRTTKDAYEAVREKFDSLLREHQTLASTSAFERQKLSEELEHARQKLTAFERTEADLDDLVMQAADTVTVGNEVERVLVSYGAVAAAPPSFRRRLEQSVRLARRVLELERSNNSLRADYDKKAKDVARLGQEVADLNNLLSVARHPDQKLIVEALRSRDEELRAVKGRLHEVEAQLEAARHELALVVKQKDDMTKDMQTLLNHRDELAQIRHQLAGNGGRHNCYSPSFMKRQNDNNERPSNSVNQRKAAGNAAHISPPVLLH